jgi:hypothetical protein
MDDDIRTAGGPAVGEPTLHAARTTAADKAAGQNLFLKFATPRRKNVSWQDALFLLSYSREASQALRVTWTLRNSTLAPP